MTTLLHQRTPEKKISRNGNNLLPPSPPRVQRVQEQLKISLAKAPKDRTTELAHLQKWLGIVLEGVDEQAARTYAEGCFCLDIFSVRGLHLCYMGSNTKEDFKSHMKTGGIVHMTHLNSIVGGLETLPRPGPIVVL